MTAHAGKAILELAALAARLSGTPAARIEWMEGACPRTVATWDPPAGNPPASPSARSTPSIQAASGADFPFGADFPIRSPATGKEIGSLRILDRKPIPPDGERAVILESLANQAAAILHLDGAEGSGAPSRDDRLLGFLDNFPDAVLVHAAGTILFANAAAADLSGASGPEDFKGRPVSYFFERDSAESAGAEKSRRPRNGSGPLPGALPFRLHDGRKILAEVATFPLGSDGEGRQASIVRDVSARMATAERLRESEGRLRVFADVFRNIQVGLFVWRLEGTPAAPVFRLLAINAAAARMTGLSMDDLIGKTMQEAFPGIFHLGLDEKCSQAILAGETIDLGEVAYGDSRTPPGHFTAKVVPLPNDTAAIAFVNVTEERRNREVLRQSIERFELIARATNDAVWEFKPATGETWWNERACQLFQCDPARTPGLDAWMERLHPDDREGVLDSFRKTAEGAMDTWVREYRFLRGSDGYGHIYERGYVLRGEDGTPVRILGAMMDITERKRAEAAVRESEEKYRKLVEVSPDVIAMILDGKLEFINRAGLAFYGAEDGAELMGRQALEFFHPDCREIVTDRLRQLDTGTEIPPMDLKFLRKDGGAIEAESRAIAFQYRGKRAKLAVIRDITERKRAEAALRSSEERYRTLAAVSPVGLYRTDLEGRFTFVNEYFCKVSGRPREELLGRPGVAVLHADDVDWVVAAWNKALEAGVIFQAEYRLVRPDGGVAWVMGNALSDSGPEGDAIGFLGTIMDITERKQAEIRLACQKRTLAMVAAGSPVQEVLDGLVGQIESESPRTVGAVLQADPESGRLLWLAAPSIPPILKGLVPSFPMDQCSGALGASTAAREYALTRDIAGDPDAGPELGQILAHGLRACASRPILGSRGQALGVLAFFYRHAGEPAPYELKLMDTASDLAAVTIERARQEDIDRKNQELSEQNRRIQEASRMKSEFLANMSHELRTPLNAIIGFSQLLIDHKVGPVNGKQIEYLGDILDGGMHLLRLINDVLDLAKIEAGKMQLFPERLDLAQTMREVCDILLPMALGKGVVLHADADPGAEKAAAERACLDGQKVRQVLYNLVSNAIKFSRHGGRVTVGARLDASGRIRIEVSDQGIGIRKEDIGKLFHQFHQLDSGSARNYAGTGLGLVITKKLVEMHGGCIEVESEAGHGSVFAALFPVSISA